MRLFISSALVFIGLFAVAPFGVVHATVLQPIANVTIQNAHAVSLGSMSATFSFDITNNERVSFNNLYYGISLQSDKGNTVYTVKGKLPFGLPGGTTVNKTLSFTAPETLNGTYTVVATVTNRSGGVLSNAIIQTIHLAGVVTNEDGFTCSFSNTKQKKYTCTIPAGNTVQYSIYRGGPFGKEVRTGIATTTQNGKTVAIDTSTLRGRFGITTSLLNTKGATLAQKTDTFSTLGEWIAISGIQQTPVKNGVISVNIFVAGSGESSNRGFVYAVLDKDGNVCSSGKTILRYIIPSRHTILAQVPASCINPTFAGFLYDGMNQNGTYSVTESFGTVSAQALMAKGVGGSKPTHRSGANSTWQLLVWLNKTWVLLGLLLAGGVIYGVVRGIKDKKFIKKGLLTIFFIFAGMSALGYAPPVHAMAFTTADNPNTATFTVNLNKTTFQPTESIGFTFGIAHNGVKPSGATVLVAVDNGTPVQIVGAPTTSTTYAISLKAISTSGAHTLNFTVPGLCGSAFDYSRFGMSTFGSINCTFSVPFTVTSNITSSTPQIRASCVSGTANTIGLRTVNNGQVYYSVNFNNGKLPTRVPSSGYVNPYPLYTNIIYSGWTSPGVKKISVQATDIYGAHSRTGAYSVMCTPPPPVCAPSVTCDSTGPHSRISAQPVLVKRNAKTTLHWNLANVQNCSVKGSNGDAWGWNTVKAQKQITTGSIPDGTTYTISCSSFKGVPSKSSTKVYILPKWKQL